MKLTRFNLSQPEEDEIETPLAQQHELVPEPEIVEVNEPEGEIEIEELNLPIDNTSIQDC